MLNCKYIVACGSIKSHFSYILICNLYNKIYKSIDHCSYVIPLVFIRCCIVDNTDSG